MGNQMYERLREKRLLQIEQWKKDLLEMGFATYADYLKSHLWASIKRQVMDKAKGKCRLCRKEAEVVHHRRYDRDVMEGKRNCHLIALCRSCHHIVEFNQNGQKRTSRGAEIAYRWMMKRTHRGEPFAPYGEPNPPKKPMRRRRKRRGKKSANP